MRLWSIHPKYLDVKGLVALWREALLAQKVLQGKTKGYQNHPQLIRFQSCNNPIGAIASYLRHVADEADKRNYCFDRTKISPKWLRSTIPVTRGQIKFEFCHLQNKLKKRDMDLYNKHAAKKIIILHPLFERVNGGIEEWEKI